MKLVTLNPNDIFCKINNFFKSFIKSYKDYIKQKENEERKAQQKLRVEKLKQLKHEEVKTVKRRKGDSQVKLAKITRKPSRKKSSNMLSSPQTSERKPSLKQVKKGLMNGSTFRKRRYTRSTSLEF